MISRTVVIQAVAIPAFALFALGSSSSNKTGDTGPSASASSAATVTDNKVRGNCYDEKRGACTETYSVYGVESDKKLCESMGGKWTASAECPRKDTLWGICTQMEVSLSAETATDIHERTFYYNEGGNRLRGGQTRATAGAEGKDACGALSGKWEAGPASTAGASPSAPPGKGTAAAAKSPPPTKK